MCPYDTTIGQQRRRFPNVARRRVQITGFLEDMVDCLRVRHPHAVLLHADASDFSQGFEYETLTCAR